MPNRLTRNFESCTAHVSPAVQCGPRTLNASLCAGTSNLIQVKKSLMSALGQERTLTRLSQMSALPPKADIH